MIVLLLLITLYLWHSIFSDKEVKRCLLFSTVKISFITKLAKCCVLSQVRRTKTGSSCFGDQYSCYGNHEHIKCLILLSILWTKILWIFFSVDHATAGPVWTIKLLFVFQPPYSGDGNSKSWLLHRFLNIFLLC